jgi:hypothetical protein
MPYVPYRRGTLLIPSGPSGDHLFGVITDICAEGRHLIVNISSIPETGFYDATCVIGPGEHPFVTKPSYAYYSMADIQAAERLGRMVDGWVYRRHNADLSPDLAQRIEDGVLASPHTKRRIKNYYRALGG